jgi:LacI family transcriptional regulator
MEKPMATIKKSRRRTTSSPTIAEVSVLAGVSPMTVSRVINGEQRVRDQTRERVQDAIATLGYRPNSAAQQLAGGQLCRIALLYNNPSSAYLSDLLVGVLGQAAASGAELIVEQFGDSDIANIAKILVKQRIDAVILPPPLSDTVELLEQLSQAHLHAAIIATSRAHENCHSITLDDEAAAHAMTRYLIGKGHRRIGFIKGNPNQTASDLRYRGYCRALADHGLSPTSSYIAQGDFSFKSGVVAAEKILLGDDVPTAIFASNDDMAAGVIATAHRFNLKVPDQLSVCGFDDTSMAVSTWPELTTIRQPVIEMARLAVELLVKSINGRRDGHAFPAQNSMLDFELIERGSVAMVSEAA